MNKHIIYSLYQIGAIQFGEFKLKSGLTSTVYINLRKIISYPNILQAIAEMMWEQIHNCNFELICGVPYTALPIATCISIKHQIPMVMRRKERKEHGTKQSIEGDFQPGQSCLIIEDIVTTGSSILETATDLEREGIKIYDVVALIDGERNGRENLEKKYNLHTLFTLSSILQTLLDSTLLDPLERRHIEEFLLKRSA